MRHTLALTDMNVWRILRTKSLVVSASEADRALALLQKGTTVHREGLKLKPTNSNRRFRVFYV